MPTPEVIALADEVQAHLEWGDLVGLGPVYLGPDGIFADAERAARIVLADVAHRSELEPSLESPTNIQYVVGALAGPDLPQNRPDGGVLPQTCRPDRRTRAWGSWPEAT
jgi:hypothetical protein